MLNPVLRATATSANRNKTATDAEFKAFLGVFVDNQLTVLYMPEWPGSVIGLLSMARLLVGSEPDLLRDPMLTYHIETHAGLARQVW